MEAVINRLTSAINETRAITTIYYEEVNKLTNFKLSCDSEVSDKVDVPGGVIPVLNNLINNLAFQNRRNVEILNHLNTLL